MIENHTGNSNSTTELILIAMEQLLQSQPYRMINVSKLCEVAAVSRSTFYRTFENKDEVLIRLMKHKTRTIINRFNELERFDFSNPAYADLERANVRYFEYWYEERAFLTKILQNDLWEMFSTVHRERFTVKAAEMFRNKPNTNPTAYYYAWHCGAMSEVLRLWTEREFIESPKEIGHMAVVFSGMMSCQVMPN